MLSKLPIWKKIVKVNPILHNVLKWLDTLQKFCSICSKSFKACLTIMYYWVNKYQSLRKKFSFLNFY